MKNLSNEAVHLAIVTAGVLVITAATAIVLANSEEYGSLIFFIFMAGTIGGIANNYRRLFKFPSATTELDEPAAKLFTIQIYLSPLIGGIFGTVLYGIFMSQLLQGALFPSFKSTELDFEGMPAFADLTLPATNADTAKALLWAFIAGFAERFVPNFIDRIAKEAAGPTEPDAGQSTTAPPR